MAEEAGTYDPTSDRDEIHTALDGGKETIGRIVEIICSLNNEKRQKLVESYAAAYGEKLQDKLKKKLGGALEDLIVDLLKPSIEYDAEQLYKSMKGAGTDEELLDEIIITRPSNKMIDIANKYKEMYNVTLEEDIIGDTSKEYKKILIAMTKGKRSENPYPNTKKIQQIVEELKGKPENKGKIDKDLFVKYFATCSFGEICAIYRAYERICEKDILTVIDKEIGGDFGELLNFLLKYISDSGRFFAEKIKKLDKEVLNRILVSRNEVDIDEIREAYKDLYGKELVDAIKEKKYDENYEKALLMLVQK